MTEAEMIIAWLKADADSLDEAAVGRPEAEARIFALVADRNRTIAYRIGRGEHAPNPSTPGE